MTTRRMSRRPSRAHFLAASAIPQLQHLGSVQRLVARQRFGPNGDALDYGSSHNEAQRLQQGHTGEKAVSIVRRTSHAIMQPRFVHI